MKRELSAPYIRSLESDAQSRVRSSLKRTARGDEKDLVTPLISDRDNPDQGRNNLRLELYPQVLSRYDWLNDAEQAQFERIGSYSQMVPYVDREEQVHSYFTRSVVEVNIDALIYARRRFRSIFQFNNLIPTSLHTAFRNMPKGTNLGGPFYSSDRSYYDEMFEIAQDLERDHWSGNIMDPALLYWRGQPRGLGELPKQRTVWGFPHYLTIAELSVQEVLLQKLRPMYQFAAWNNPKRVSEVVTWMLSGASDQILSVDFSGYDASVPSLLIDEVFDVIEELFQDAYIPLIEFLRRSFLNIELLTPEGILSGRSGAIPSGSGLTNLVGGMIQLFAFEYISHRMDNVVLMHTVQGDDGVVIFHKPWDIEDVAGYAKEIGLTISTDKRTVSSVVVTFLQNVYHIDYRVRGLNEGVRPIMRVLNGMMSYERLVSQSWNGFLDSLRWYQQCENSRYHPNFMALARFLFAHDRLSRSYTANQILQKAGGIRKAESVLKQPAFPFGKTSLRGLDNFTIVRALAHLRQGDGKSVEALD